VSGVRSACQSSASTPIGCYGFAFACGCIVAWQCSSKRIMHRDLKTSNIFLHSRDRVIKLGDFGISRVLQSEQSMARTQVRAHA